MLGSTQYSHPEPHGDRFTDPLLAELEDGRVGNRVLNAGRAWPLRRTPDLAANIPHLTLIWVSRLPSRRTTLSTSAAHASRTTYSVIALLLIAMAVIVASVGGIALSGVLSISVLERRRESACSAPSAGSAKHHPHAVLVRGA